MSDEEHQVDVEANSSEPLKDLKRKAGPTKNGKEASTSEKKSNPFYSNISEIKNKIKIGEKYVKLKKEKKKVKSYHSLFVAAKVTT